MRAHKTEAKKKPWFRIENAWVDEENKNEEVTPVYIYDEIGDSWWGESTSASDFIQQIGTIKTPRIELHLNSPGGDIFDGVAIYNALKAHPAKVTVIVDALAASAASFIAQSGDEIIMTKAATMMIHDGSAIAWGPAAVMRETADLLDKLSNIVAEIYADRAGQSTEFWRNLMIEEVWYNSHEAVESGLADKIGEDTKDEDDEAAQNKWDFSIFNHAGRSAAPDPFQIRQRIANRLKETTVGKPQNTGGEKVPEGGTPSEAGSPETDSNTEVTDSDTDSPVEDTQTPVDKTPKAPVATRNEGTGKWTFVVAGVSTEDHAVVQSRLNFLEEFRNESVKQSKVDFVNQLASDNKIMASQIDKLLKYVNSLDDAQYAAWKDTWEGVSGLPMLDGSHAEGTTNHAGSQTQAGEEVAAKIETKKEIVQQHKLSGMSEEKIKQTKSYKDLLELDPNFKL